jgi:uncharacterized lipoprotein YehR (DUF1307 family)
MKMKRNSVFKVLVYTLMASMSLFAFAGCGQNNDGDTPELTAADLFPLEENVLYEYEGTGNEFAAFTVFNEYLDEDSVQQRIDNGGTVIARVYVIGDGKVTRTLSRGETYYRENMMDQTDADQEVVLMEPIEEGTTWQLGDGSTRTITGVDVDVETPAGDYKCVEVVTEGENATTTDYYAKDVGLVKTATQLEGEDTEISSTLKQITTDAERLETVQFFFPNINDDLIYIKNYQVSFRTNSVTTEVLEAGYKAALVDNVGAVLGANTKINSLKLNEDGKVELDLSSEFVTEMSAGAGYEMMLLQSLANTFCRYYNAEEMILTIDGETYTSGHIDLEPGQSIKADYEGNVEIDV